MMNSSNSSDINPLQPYTPKIFVSVAFLLCLLIIVTSGIAIVTLCQCKKLVYQIKFGCINLTIANLGYGIAMLLTALHFGRTGKICVALFKLHPLWFSTYYLFLTAIGIDRLLSLKVNIQYTFWTRSRNAYIAAVFLYVIGILLNIPNIEFDKKIQCEGSLAELFNDDGFLVFSGSLVCLVFIQVIVYSCIGYNAIQRHQIKQGTDNEEFKNINKVFKRFWKVTVKSFYLSVLTSILLGPFVSINIIEIILEKRTEDRFSSLKHFTLILTFIHQFASPIFILLTYKECRYIFKRTIYFFNESKRQKLINSYKQYYATYELSILDSVKSKQNASKGHNTQEN